MDVCARLWCAVIRHGQMVCLTKKLPAVEGTPCGKGRICLHGKCVDKTRKRHYSVSGIGGPDDVEILEGGHRKWTRIEKIDSFLQFKTGIVSTRFHIGGTCVWDEKDEVETDSLLCGLLYLCHCWPRLKGPQFNLVSAS